MASAQQVCPVLRTTTTVLPPSHPPFDASAPGLVCPVTNATSDHHALLSPHPGLPGSVGGAGNAQACPALRREVEEPAARALDEDICPVVGAVCKVLPIDHPHVSEADEDKVCPKTNASLRHHRGKVVEHPNVEEAPEGAVCPVVGAKA